MKQKDSFKSFKLIISANAEGKIRYLQERFPSTEWSGALFISHEEKDNVCTITAEDIYPMNVGSSVFTEFNFNEEVTSYMANHPETFEWDLALVHSHHNMSTHPSQTDMDTLISLGEDINSLLSLIVNNVGEYTAMLSRKATTKTELITKDITNTLFDGTYKSPIPEKKCSDDTVVVWEYVPITIIKSEPITTIKERVDEIEAKHLKLLEEYKYPKQGEFDFMDRYYNHLSKENTYYPTIWGDEVPIVSGDLQELALKAVQKMVKCNINIDAKTSVYELQRFVSNYMNTLYTRNFANSKYGSYTLFDDWAYFITEFILNKYSEEGDEETFIKAVLDILYELDTQNYYITKYIEILEGFLPEEDYTHIIKD